MAFYGCVSYFRAQSLNSIDQTHVISKSFRPEIGFILLAFDGFIAFFLCSKLALFWPNLWFFNINSALKVIHLDNILSFIAYFCAHNLIYFDQTNDFVTYLGPQIWFRLTTFYGCLTFVFKIWTNSTIIMIFETPCGRKFDSIRLCSRISLHIFVLKIRFVLTNFISNSWFSTKNWPKFWLNLLTFCGVLANFHAQNWTYFNHVNDFVTFLCPKSGSFRWRSTFWRFIANFCAQSLVLI